MKNMTEGMRDHMAGCGQYTCTALGVDNDNNSPLDVADGIGKLQARVDELEAIIRAGFLVTCGDVTYATFGYPCMSSQHNTTIMEICKPSSDVPTAPGATPCPQPTN